MKTVKKIIFLVEKAEEGGYMAKALGESIYTEANTLEQLKLEIKDAVNCHFYNEEKPIQIYLSYK